METEIKVENGYVKIEDVYVAAKDGKLFFRLPHVMSGNDLQNWKIKHAKELLEIKMNSKN